MQNEFSLHNQLAWNQGAYAAWVNRYGNPKEAAEAVRLNPASRIRTIAPFVGDMQGLKVANLLGSHGMKATAMLLLGAREATVVDISEENARYAREVAKEAGVPLRYVVSDVLKLPAAERTGDYDLAFMEFGILHYFVELEPLFGLVSELLKPGGRMLLQDFHPVSTKLISSRGTTARIRKHKVDGDYFDSTIQEVEVAYSKFMPKEEQGHAIKAKQRKWTLGETVTAIAAAGLFVELLREEPNQSSEDYDRGIPKSFTIVARKQ